MQENIKLLLQDAEEAEKLLEQHKAMVDESLSKFKEACIRLFIAENGFHIGEECILNGQDFKISGVEVYALGYCHYKGSKKKKNGDWSKTIISVCNVKYLTKLK